MDLILPVEGGVDDWLPFIDHGGVEGWLSVHLTFRQQGAGSALVLARR